MSTWKFVRRSGWREMLTMMPEKMTELGVATNSPSSVTSSVWNRPISCTVPVMAPVVILSATRNGRSNSSITPDATLDRVPCSARPMARPAAPRSAINDVVCTPNWPSTATSVIAITHSGRS